MASRRPASDLPDLVVVACKLQTGINIDGHIVARTRSASDDPRRIVNPDLINGYALTVNFPGEVWRRWLAANEKSAMVVKCLIFAGPSRDAVIAKCRRMSGPFAVNQGAITGVEINPLA